MALKMIPILRGIPATDRYEKLKHVPDTIQRFIGFNPRHLPVVVLQQDTSHD